MNITKALKVCTIILVFITAAIPAAAEKADTILTGGHVLTLDKNMTITEAVAIKDGKILFTGTAKKTAAFKGKSTRVIDLKGNTIIPGLHDAHLHFESGSQNMVKSVNLRFLNLEQIRAKIKAVVKASPKGAVIRAVGFNHAFFKGKRWPSRKDLDDIAPGNPVLIRRVDGHSYWLNSKALEMSGITAKTKDPQGGEVQRFKDGTPTGILKETAMRLIKNIEGPKMVIPGISGKDPVEAGIEFANRLGLTSVTTSGSLELIGKLNKLKAAGKLTLRFNVWLDVSEMDKLLKKKVGLNQGDDFVKVSFIKIFADGTIGSATAAMFKPYKHRPESKGLLIYPVPKLDALIEKAHKNHWQIGVHAIGNRGVRLVLDAVEKAQKKHGVKGLRHRIEHSQFVTDADVMRYKTLGMVPSMQPTHCTTDLLVAEDRIGKERARQGYRWNSFHKNGIMMSFGTDWPVEPLDPRRGIYSSVERKNIENGKPEGGWFPNEQISLLDALKYYTLGAAYGCFSEKKLGTIEKGKYADLTVYGGDMQSLAKKDKKALLTMPVVMTMVQGKIVYEK